jgi:K+-transporting ATPase ATPase A chain
MSWQAWIQVGLYMTILLALVKPLGAYMAKVYENKPVFLDRLLRPLERALYRIAGVNPEDEMGWKAYTVAFLLFNFLGFLLVYALQRFQAFLPLNPQQLGAVSPDSSFNTAMSFATNTNWQGYGGETTMSYFTQMLGLTTQNFVSAASGMAVLVALIRGFARRTADTVGNFWFDLVRSTLYVLLPLSVVVALLLVSQGVVQTFAPYKTVPLLQAVQGDGGKAITEQVLALGPAASQIAIKQLGTNGGGFFNVNSSHPFENATPLSNLVEMLAILLIPAALTYTFGKMVRKTREGWALLAAMLAIFVPVTLLACIAEQSGNPVLSKLGADQAVSALQNGGNMEGKEVRFGIANSALWASATTSASNGSVNSMHDSFTPLGGLVPLFNMHLDEIVFGGVGSGLYGMIVYAIIAVFVAGLMVGRTPEYLGKKIEAFEMKMSSLFILVPAAFILLGTAVALLVPVARASMANPAAHGFSEVLYAFSSASENNGSAFAGISANTPFYNLALGAAMFFGRYWLAIVVLAMAGSLARKKIVPVGAGTLPTDTPLFVAMLVGVILIVTVLCYLPAYALGPIVEHLILFS